MIYTGEYVKLSMEGALKLAAAIHTDGSDWKPRTGDVVSDIAPVQPCGGP